MSLLCEIRISDIIEILSTIVALLIGVQSIRQSNKEIKMSNKQAMFEKRYEIYLLLQHMDELCNDNLNLLNRGEHLGAIDFVASCLTNSVHFYQICDGFGKIDDNDAQTKFLSLIEELKDYGVQARLLFPKKHALYISRYFENYANLLAEMRRYEILLNNVNSIPDITFETNEQKMVYQQATLQGDLAKGIENDVKKYEESLHNLHNEYETNKKQLDKYLTLSEMK